MGVEDKTTTVADPALTSLSGDEHGGGEGDKLPTVDGGKKPGEEGQAPKKDGEPPVVPDEYKLKLPDGVIVDPAMMKDFTGVLKEMKASPETAQKLADMHLKVIGAFSQAQAEQHTSEVVAWSDAVSTDKDLGGAKLTDTMAQARKTWNYAATIPGVDMKRLQADMDKTGLVTHPDLIRVFHHFGQYIGEDNKFLGVTPKGGGGTKDAATVLYGEEKK